MTTIGYATLQIIPSLEGVSKSLDKQLGFLKGAGKNAGKQLGNDIASGVDAAAAKITQASKKIEAARGKEADAAGKLRIAEERLKEVRDKGATGSTLARAEEAREKAYRGQATALKNVQSETRELTRAEKELAAARDRAADAGKRSFGNVGGGASTFLSGITSELNGVTSKFSTVGKGAGAGFAAGAVAALLAGGLIEAGKSAANLVADGFKSVVDAGVDFDKTFNNFQAVTGSSTAQMAAFRQEAVALGGDTQIAGANAADAATAMTELAKAGFSVDQAMTAARGTLQLSAAAQISAAEAATIEGQALNTFKLGADQAGHAADVLANVSIAASGEMSDFALGLSQAGAVANSTGVSLEDTAATLGVLAKDGIKGSDAGTLLKSTLLALQSPSDQASQALDMLGVSAYDANGNFVGMHTIFQQLFDANKRLTPEMYAMATGTAFGSDAARLAGIAASEGAEGWDTMRTAVEKQGTAAQVAATQNQGLPGVLENINNTVDTLKLTFYDLIRGPLTEIGGAFQNGITAHKPELIGFFTDLATAVTTGIAGSLRSMGLFTEGIGQMIGGVGNLVGVINQTAEGLAFLTGDTDKQKYFHDAAQGAFSWGEGLESAGQALRTAADKVDAFTPKLQETGDAAKNAAAFARDLGDKVKLLPDNKTIVLKDNMDVVGLNLDTTKYKIENLPDGSVKIEALTQQATDQMDAWRRSQSTAPPAAIAVTADTKPAQAVIDSFKRQLQGQAPPPGPPPPASALDPTFFVPKPPGRAGGGSISGPGTGTSDSVPIWASNGEFVVRAAAARKNMPLLEIINSGKMPGYSGGGLVGPDVLAAQAMAGTPYSKGNRTDCSGMAARVIARALGLPESGLMTTKNAAQWLAAAGFQQGTGLPGQISVGWYDHGPGQNDGHMALTLSDGTNAESGGKNGVFTLGAGAAGANSPQFDQHMFLPTLFGEGQAGSLGSGGGYGGAAPGSAGVGPNGEAGTYSAPDAKSVREANEKVADADARSREADLRVKELKADASESERASAQNAADKAKREAADARADLAEVQKGKFTPGSSSDAGGAGGSSKLSLPSSFSGFGSAIGEFAGGQISSALGVLGIGDSPPWLQAASQLVGGISIGGKSAGPLSAGGVGGGALPLDAVGNTLHGTLGGQAPGPGGDVYNISTARVEDAFLMAQRKKDERIAAKTGRY